MTPDDYIAEIISEYEVQRGASSATEQAARRIAPAIVDWAGEWLHCIAISGSYAKGTAVSGGSDIDLFISLKASTPGRLKMNYDSLYKLALLEGWSPRQQNVSIGIQSNGAKIDLVPARIQLGRRIWHSLYRRKAGSWTQTNVDLHISRVGNSKRIDEIRAIKIWRNLRSIDFPSFYLELTVINALYGRPINTLADNVFICLQYLSKSFLRARVIDPANTNNCISDDLTLAEKRTIANAANLTLQAGTWEEVIW